MIEEKDKDFSIYEVPLSLVENGLDKLIVKRLGLTAGTLDMDVWRDLLHRLRNPKHEISIAVVGKYAEHRDAYKSIYEAIDHAGIEHHAQIRVGRILKAKTSNGKAPNGYYRDTKEFWYRADSANVEPKAKSRQFAGPGNARSRSWEFAWACNAPPSSSPAM